MDIESRWDALYAPLARVGQALASPKRLQMLDRLAQGERSVDGLAGELAIGIKLASAHLKALRDAGLVQRRRDGKHMVYRLSGPDVARLGVHLREVAEAHRVGVQAAPRQRTAAAERPAPALRGARAEAGAGAGADRRPAGGGGGARPR